MIVRVSFIGEYTKHTFPFKCIAKNKYQIRTCGSAQFDLQEQQLTCINCGSVYDLLPQFIITETDPLG